MGTGPWEAESGVWYRVTRHAPPVFEGAALEHDEAGGEGDFVLRVSLAEMEAWGWLTKLELCGLAGCDRPVMVGERGRSGRWCSGEHRAAGQAAERFDDSEAGQRYRELVEEAQGDG